MTCYAQTVIMEIGMKAKEYVERYKKVTPEEKNKEIVKIVYEMIFEFEAICKGRNVQKRSGALSVFLELEQKWKAIVRLLTGEGLRDDGFRVIFSKKAPELARSLGVFVDEVGIPTIPDVDLAFGGDMDKIIPKWEEIPDKFKGDDIIWNKFVSTWFYLGIKKGFQLKARPGVDQSKALRHVGAILSSFAPKHEHKLAACAYLMDKYFEGEPVYEANKKVEDLIGGVR